MKNLLRLPAEVQYAEELEVIISAEEDTVPFGWKMSPRSVLKYITGGTVKGVEITPKYIGNPRLVEIAIATLLTDKALLLSGEPGTAKSWLSEHLSAAVCGNSKLVIQGTLGTSEEQVKYGWNYAMLIASGPSHSALVKSPIFNAMEDGQIARFEEVSRCASEVQDALISILSEKSLSLPELSSELRAKRGFSIIATANSRDRGVNDMSSALRRRFNTVILPAPATLEIEVDIVSRRVAEFSATLGLAAAMPKRSTVEKIVTIFRELRQGRTLDGKEKLKCPTSSCSTAEIISSLTGSLALSASFYDGNVGDTELASALMTTIVKDDEKDFAAYNEYLENVLKKRGSDWQGFYKSSKEIMS